MKKVKRLRSTNWQLQNSHGKVKYSIGNTVNNTLIMTYGARLVLDLLKGSVCKLRPLCCTSETKIILNRNSN